MTHYLIVAFDEGGFVATCEGDPLEAPLVRSIGNASLCAANDDTSTREALKRAIDHTLDQMGMAA